MNNQTLFKLKNDKHKLGLINDFQDSPFTLDNL